MFGYSEALWLHSGFAPVGLHLPLIHRLQRSQRLQEWCCRQEPRGESSVPVDVESVLSDLHLHLGQADRSVHLIGHGIGGVLAWLYARRYPKRVRSLTLLAVASIPALNWQTYTMMMIHRSACTRERIMAHLVRLLFGPQRVGQARRLAQNLERDLVLSLPPLLFLCSTPLAGHKPVPVPVLVCGGQEDLITSSTQILQWKRYLKSSDHLWICPRGYHCFHATAPDLVAQQILQFWSPTKS